MSTPFLGEIMMVSFGFAPKNWALCNGQLLPINQNQALFSLMGTTYGGDGRVNFALPNLQGRMPMHIGNGHTQGEAAGEVSHTLTVAELPAHTHTLYGSNTTGRAVSGASNALAASRGHYAESADTSLAASAVSNIGGSQAHLNLPPFLAITFCVALSGIFPSQN